MCGLVGIFPLNKPDKKVSDRLQRALAFWFHNELLYYTQKRGRDATGVSLSFGPKYGVENDESFWAVLKQPVDAEDFLLNDGTDQRYTGQKKNANIEYIMEAVDNIERPLIHVIGHSRAKTLGSENNTHNNHPILVGNIIGVHNGGVKNQKRILEKHPEMTQIGEVDSEAIFQLFAECSNDKPVDEEAIEYVCQRIEGPRAVMAYNRNQPHKVAFFRDSERPLEVALIKDLGLLVVCSEKDFFKWTMLAYQRMRLLYGKTLPGEERLPKVAVDTSYVSAGEGGIIDVTKEITDKTALSKFLGIRKFPDCLADYKSFTQTTTPHANPSAWNNQTKTYVPASLIESEASGAAEVEDYSDYETKEVDEDQDSVIVPQTEVMDDTSEDTGAINVTIELVDAPEDNEELNQEQEVDDGPYCDMELRLMAAGICLHDDYRKDSRSIFNREEGKIQEALGIDGFDEENSKSVLENVYPEVFSDGFIIGFRHHQDIQRDEDVKIEEKQDRLESENERLEEELASAKLKLTKASSNMANLKAFILATLLAKDLVSVDAKDDVRFDEDIEHFLGMASNGFRKVRLSTVKKMFGEKEKEAIKFGMSNQVKKMKSKGSSKSTK